MECLQAYITPRQQAVDTLIPPLFTIQKLTHCIQVAFIIAQDRLDDNSPMAVILVIDNSLHAACVLCWPIAVHVRTQMSARHMCAVLTHKCLHAKCVLY